MLFASIMEIIIKKNVSRLSQLASERILRLVIICFFVLGLVGLVIIAFSFISEKTTITQETRGKQSPNINTGTSPGKGSIKQKSSGDQSPNINSNGKAKSVEINYGYKPDKKNREGEEDLK